MDPILNSSRAKYRRDPSKLFVPPLPPTLVSEPPAGPGWEHEVKYDGHRTLIVLDYGRHAFTFKGHQWTDRYALVLAAALRLRCKSASIDGEMIVQDEHGRSAAVTVSWKSTSQGAQEGSA